MANENNGDKIKIDIQKFQKVLEVLDIVNQQQNLNLLIDDFKGAPLSPQEFNTNKTNITEGKKLIDIIPQNPNAEKLKDILNSEEFKDKLSQALGAIDKNATINLKDTPMPMDEERLREKLENIERSNAITQPTNEEESINLHINRKNKPNIDYRNTVDIPASPTFKK